MVLELGPVACGEHDHNSAVSIASIKLQSSLSQAGTPWTSVTPQEFEQTSRTSNMVDGLPSGSTTLEVSMASEIVSEIPPPRSMVAPAIHCAPGATQWSHQVRYQQWNQDSASRGRAIERKLSLLLYGSSKAHWIPGVSRVQTSPAKPRIMVAISTGIHDGNQGGGAVVSHGPSCRSLDFGHAI